MEPVGPILCKERALDRAGSPSLPRRQGSDEDSPAAAPAAALVRAVLHCAEMYIARGTRIGSYEVTGELGAGGMGEVYRARDIRLQREVALKLLPAHLTNDTERLSRFEREARVLAALSHPNIASIYGIEECATEAGRRMPVLVLELVEGETLQERVARGPLPMDEARVLALQIAEGLEAAHDKGIAHRDLKPANVQITPD
jgi:eukaryotic-like serine/threonine-protein kinase